MRLLIIAILMLGIIAVSYLADRKYPRFRIYIIPATIIVLCSIVGIASWLAPSNFNRISEEQRLTILNEQPYFITWYNEHKKNIEQLDRYCTMYHKIITEYEDNIITADVAVDRLSNLYNSCDKFDKSIQDMLPPAELSKINYTLTYEILEKTRIYSYKTKETTRQSIDIIREGMAQNLEKKDVVNNLNRIYAIEGPIILDINTEVNQLKNNLTPSE